MKVNKLIIQKINQVKEVQKNHLKENKVRGNKSDQLNISKKAQEIKILQNNLQDVSNLRQEKVEKLKKQVQSGTYNVSSKAIAEKIINKMGGG